MFHFEAIIPKNENLRLPISATIVYNSTMSEGRKCKAAKRLQKRFLQAAGPGVRMLRDMMNLLPMVAFYLKDAQGRIMALNPLNCEICNVRDETDAIGKTSSDLFPAILAEAYRARDQKVLQTGKPLIGELNTKTADRSTTPRRINTFPVFGPDGAVIGTASVIYHATDIQKSANGLSRARLSPAVRRIEDRFAERLSVPALARLVGLSETHFRRQFKDTVGCTPVAYLTTMRINAARKLLETTDRPIADIAQEVGFSDHAHLIRTFRALRGLTPGEYRQRHPRY